MKTTAMAEEPRSAYTLTRDPEATASAPENTPHTPVRRKVGLARRIALHIGIALIIWGRGTARRPLDGNQLALQRAERAARAQREIDAQRRWTLMGMGMPR